MEKRRRYRQRGVFRHEIMDTCCVGKDKGGNEKILKKDKTRPAALNNG